MRAGNIYCSSLTHQEKSSATTLATAGFKNLVGILEVVPLMRAGARSEKSGRRMIEAGHIPARKWNGPWPMDPAEVVSALRREVGLRDTVVAFLALNDGRCRENRKPAQTGRAA